MNSIRLALSSQLLLFLCLLALASGQGIGIEERYWTYEGRKVLLIGGWNHGHNPFLDHDTMDANGRSGASTEAQITAALDELAQAGGNLLRCVLDPGVGAGVQGFDFCVRSGALYDLNRMAGPYWTRLAFFLREAQQRRIIVQIEIWDRFDWYNGGHEGWPTSPFNPKNNVNYTVATSGLAVSYPGKGDKTNNPFGQTTAQQTAYRNASPKGKAQFDLVRLYQEKFMDKFLSVTFAYDNVLYAANNEVRHQEPAWGQYWIAYIKRAAALAGKTVLCTDMFWDLLDLPGPCDFDLLMANPKIYEYFDVSQTSAHRSSKALQPRVAGHEHWKKVSYAAQKAKAVNRLLHVNKIYGSAQAGLWMGTADGAIGEFWRSLMAGVAGVRFHRPESGIGLSKQSKDCMRTVRLLEEKVKFWEVESRQDLLSDCALDEAYLAAQAGEKYILFLTDGGGVGLSLGAYAQVGFELTWFDIDSGRPGPAIELAGGKTIDIAAPGPGPWAAAITRRLK